MSWKDSSVQHKACGVMMVFSSPNRGALGLDRFALRDVETGASDTAGAEHVGQRPLVVDRVAPHVDVVGRLLPDMLRGHLPQFLGRQPGNHPFSLRLQNSKYGLPLR
jgi:hypothetical protein